MISGPERDADLHPPILTSAARRHFIPSVFSIVPDHAVRRRAGDLAAVVTAVVVVAVTAAAAVELPKAEQALLDLISSLPAGLVWICEGYALLLGVAVLTLLAGALISRRLRLAGTIVIAGLISAVVAAALSAEIDVAAAVTEAGSPEYPPTWFTVASGVLLSALPYLTRPARRLALSVIGFSGVCVVFVGDALPGAVIGAAAVAWGAASAVRFTFGTPAGTPATTDVSQALMQLGVEVDDLELAESQPWGETRFTGRDHESGAGLMIEVFGRDATDARLFAKLWRTLWYRDSGPRLTLNRVQLVEHRAYLLLLAQRAGARVPELVGAGVGGDLETALVVTSNPSDAPLFGATATEVSDAVLADAWANLARLHRARIAHGEVLGSSVLLGDHGSTTLIDFSRASASAPPERLLVDRAAMALAIASVVGCQRALISTRDALGEMGLAELLPRLQPSLLTRRGRREVPEAKSLLDEMRTGGAEQLGIDLPPLADVRRVSITDVVMAAGTILGVYLLLGQFAEVKSVGDVFAGAQWDWIAVAALLSQTPQLAAAEAMRGSVIARIPLGAATGVQFANNFTGFIGGTVATTALVVRFFQKQGQPAAVAVSSGVLNTFATIVAETVLVIVCLLFSLGTFDLGSAGGGSGGGTTGETDDAAWVVALVLAVGAGSGIVLLVPRLRRRVGSILGPQLRAGRQNLHEVTRDPRKAAQLFGGNLAAQLLFALTLSASLRAYGSELPLPELVLINCFASFLGGIAPVPGGMGVIEAGLIGGLTAAGVPETTAMAATFTHRTFTAYLPPIWGWFALRWLRARDYL